MQVKPDLSKTISFNNNISIRFFDFNSVNSVNNFKTTAFYHSKLNIIVIFQFICYEFRCLWVLVSNFRHLEYYINDCSAIGFTAELGREYVVWQKHNSCAAIEKDSAKNKISSLQSGKKKLVTVYILKPFNGRVAFKTFEIPFFNNLFFFCF